MSETRFSRMQKAVALVPMALLSTAWTASLVGVGVGGGAGAAVADTSDHSRLPDGTTVPSQAIEDPASFTAPGSLGLGAVAGRSKKIVQTASTNGIPSAALSAYQRAATVINSADKGCQIPWQLVAAIGRVESDHGRYGGNTLGKDGVSRPGIYGVALDGSNKTQAISDTDAGQYDNDVKFDRAVGPMQFIPSTWSVVGVDADGDSKRNPQDIDDAALAAAVYLCSGNDDLSTAAGQEAAVHRYNHSDSYVDLVRSIAQAYTDGDFSSVPNNTTSAVTFTPDNDYTHPNRFKGPKYNNNGNQAADAGTGTKTTGTDNGGGTTSDDPGTDSTPGDNGGSDDKGGNDGSTNKPSKDPVENTKKTIEKTTKKVEETLTRGAASVQCGLNSTLSRLLNGLGSLLPWQQKKVADYQACMSNKGF